MEMGIDRILFAVDWPFVPNPPGTKWMEGVPLCDEDKAKILSGNAKRRRCEAITFVSGLHFPCPAWGLRWINWSLLRRKPFRPHRRAPI